MAKEDLKPEKIKLTKEEKVLKAESARNNKSWRLTTANNESVRVMRNLKAFDYNTNTPEWTIDRNNAANLTKGEADTIQRLLNEHHSIISHIIPS